MPEPTPTPHLVAQRPWAPSWAVVADHPCVTVRCSHCGEDERGGDSEFTPHYDSVNAALESVLELDWAQDGDRLLCRSCAEEILCPRDGHTWEHHAYEGWIGSDGVAVPPREFWDCKYCDETTYDDPSPTPGADQPGLFVVPGGGDDDA